MASVDINITRYIGLFCYLKPRTTLHKAVISQLDKNGKTCSQFIEIKACNFLFCCVIFFVSCYDRIKCI